LNKAYAFALKSVGLIINIVIFNIYFYYYYYYEQIS